MFTWPHSAQRTAPAESWLSSLFTWELLWLAWAPTSPTKGWNPRQNFLPFILTGSLHTVSACWMICCEQAASRMLKHELESRTLIFHSSRKRYAVPPKDFTWRALPCVPYLPLRGSRLLLCEKKAHSVCPHSQRGLIKLLSGIRCRAVVTGSWEGWREGWWRPPTGYKATVRQRKSQHSTVE